MMLLAMFLVLVALVLIDVPIAVGLGVVAMLAMVITAGPASLPNAGIVLYDGSMKFPLIAIPLFILAGAIMNATGISRRHVAFASAIFGFVRGGLSMATIGDAPLMRRAWITFRPMPPTPNTAAPWPGWMSALLNTVPTPVMTPHPIRHADSRGTSVGIRTAWISRTTTSSANTDAAAKSHAGSPPTE